MKQILKGAINHALNGAGHRFIGYTLFCLLYVAVLLFCVWFKGAFWQEPLGIDGVVVSIVFTALLYKGFPVIERLINK